MACYLEGQLLAEPDSRIGVFQGATLKRCRAPKKGCNAVVLKAIPRMGETEQPHQPDSRQAPGRVAGTHGVARGEEGGVAPVLAVLLCDLEVHVHGCALVEFRHVEQMMAVNIERVEQVGAAQTLAAQLPLLFREHRKHCRAQILRVRQAREENHERLPRFFDDFYIC